MWHCGGHWASNDSCMWRRSCQRALMQAQNQIHSTYETCHISHSDKVHSYVTYRHSNIVTKSTDKCIVSGYGSEQSKGSHTAKLDTACTLCRTVYCFYGSYRDDNDDKNQFSPGSGCSCVVVYLQELPSVSALTFHTCKNRTPEVAIGLINRSAVLLNL